MRDSASFKLISLLNYLGQTAFILHPQSILKCRLIKHNYCANSLWFNVLNSLAQVTFYYNEVTHNKLNYKLFKSN